MWVLNKSQSIHHVLKQPSTLTLTNSSLLLCSSHITTTTLDEIR